jgi:broad specificity phosphatase PhoE
MTALFVLRHPETTWNAERRYQGRLESPVSPQGKTQSRLVVQAFAGQTLDAVYSSPLGRAQYLARELAQATDAPLLVDLRLTEMAQGPWEGLYLADIERLFPQLYAQWYSRPDTLTFPGGENLEDVRKRSKSTARDIVAQFPHGQVAVVTHAVVIQVLVADALSLALGQLHSLRIANASVTTLCGRENHLSLLALNVTEPLYHSPVASAAAQNCVSWNR